MWSGDESVDELRRLLPFDNKLYGVSEVEALQDVQLARYVLQSLDHTVDLYKKEDDTLKQVKRAAEKGFSTVAALAFAGDDGVFAKKHLAWLQNQVECSAQSPTSDWESIRKYRLEVLSEYYFALARFDRRLKARKRDEYARTDSSTMSEGSPSSRASFFSRFFGESASRGRGGGTAPRGRRGIRAFLRDSGDRSRLVPLLADVAGETDEPGDAAAEGSSSAGADLSEDARGARSALFLEIRRGAELRPTATVDRPRVVEQTPDEARRELIAGLLEGAGHEELLGVIMERCDELPSFANLMYFEHQADDIDWDLLRDEADESDAGEISESHILYADSSRDMSDSLLCIILRHAFREELHRLETLGEFTGRDPELDGVESDVEAPASPKGPRRGLGQLLQLLQRDFVKNLGSLPVNPSSLDGKRCVEETLARMSAYVQTLARLSTELLRAASARRNTLLATQSVHTVDEVICSFIRDSAVGMLLHPLATIIPLTLSQVYGNTISGVVLDDLVEVLTAVDEFNSSSPSSLTADVDYIQTHAEKAAMGHTDAIVVETPHKYFPNTDEEKVVRVAGATHLVLLFDERCSLEKGRDTLQLYQGVGKAIPLFSAFSGGPSSWPRIPLVVSGDTVTFHFVSDPFRTYWGYRCIVKGLRLESSPVWMWDLERTLSSLVSDCIASLLRGPNASATEIGCAKYLDSSLFAGGVGSPSPELDPVVQDIVLGRTSSRAHTRISKVNKSLPRDMLGMLGGGEVTKTVDIFIATAVHHLGLAVALREEILSEDAAAELADVLRASRSFKQSIMRERQRRIVELEEREAEELASRDSSSGSGSFPEESGKGKEAVDTFDPTSYEYLCGVYRVKLGLLLRATPSGSNAAACLSTISSFVLETPDEGAEACLGVRRDRALQRTTACLTALALLKTMRLTTPKEDVLSSIGPALRNGVDDAGEGKHHHFLTNVCCCGPELESSLTKSFYDLYSYIASLIATPAVESVRLFGFALDAFCIDFRPADHHFLLDQGLLDILHRASEGDGDRVLCHRTTVLLAHRFLALQCSSFSGLVSDAGEAAMGELQLGVVEQLMTEILQGAKDIRTLQDSLATFSADAHEDPTFLCQASTYRSVEMATFEKLVLLCSMNNSKPGRRYMLLPKTLSMLLALFDQTSPRLERLAIRTVRHLLPDISPAAGGLGSNIASKGAFVKQLLDRIARGMLVDGEKYPGPTSTQSYRDPSVAFSLLDDLINTVRFLASCDTWQADTSRVVGSISRALPELLEAVTVDQDSSSITQDRWRIRPSANRLEVGRALAVLAILGGHTDSLHPGGRAEVRGTQERGTVVYMDRSSSRAVVVLDENKKRAIECTMEKLSPLAEVAFDFSHFNVSREFLDVLLGFLPVPIPRALRGIDARSTGSDMRNLDAAPSEWSCTRCTYLNEATAPSCEICGCGAPSTTMDSPNEEEEEEVDAEPKLPHAEADLLYIQLRSNAVKALSRLLQSSEAKHLMQRRGAFSSLVRLAIQPAALDEFKSMEQLRNMEHRLWELTYLWQRGMSDAGGPQTLAQADALPHSPFKNMPIQLPAAFDRSTSKCVKFDRELRSITARLGELSEERVGISQANALIPNTLPAFYFEVQLDRNPDYKPLDAVPEVDGLDLGLEEAGERSDTKTSSLDDKGKGAISEPTGVAVALGLAREGMPLRGVPGEHNSYAWQGDTAKLYHNVGSLRVSRVIEEGYGRPFGVGDVVGCGWDIYKKAVYFTLNGEYLGHAFDRVDGRYSPVVWLRTEEVAVTINLGQEPFRFEFAQSLPEGYLEGLQTEEQKGKHMTQAEIRRRTMAESLVDITGGFYPIELCMVALERNGDNVEYAANWLFEKGPSEMEKLFNDTIAYSQRMAEKEESSMISELLGSGPAEADGDSSAEGSVETEYTEIDEQYNRQASRFLDDEIDTDVPVQIEQQQDRVVEGMKIDDVVPRLLLRVSSNCRSVTGYSSRIGVVTDVDFDALRVQLQFYDSDTATLQRLWFYFYDLEKPDGLWQDPCLEIRHAPYPKLANELVLVSNALVVLLVRRAVLGLIAEWTELDLDLVGGPAVVIDLLKLAAAEYLSYKAEGRNQLQITTSNAVLDAFRSQLSRLLQAEEGLPAMPLNLPEYDVESGEATGDRDADMGTSGSLGRSPSTTCLADSSGSLGEPEEILDIKTLVSSRGTLVSSAERGGEGPSPRPPSVGRRALHLSSDKVGKPLVSVTQVVTEECVLHFFQAVKVPPPILAEESAHPTEPNQELRKRIHVRGASKLLIRFDPRTNTNTDILTRVAFYRDDQYQDPIATYRGVPEGGNFKPIVLSTDTFWFRYTSGPGSGTEFWGFRFTVTPLEWRLSDKQALRGLNFELGYWFLELLLEHGPSVVLEVYITALYDALVWYIRAAKRSAKGRGIQLLLRVLREVGKSPGALEKVDLGHVLKLREKMNAIYEVELEETDLLHSTYLQSLVELIAVARLVGGQGAREEAVEDGMAAEEGTGKGKELVKARSGEVEVEAVDLANLAQSRLRILSARYGVLENSAQCRDVREPLQALVDRWGGDFLLLPPDYQNIVEAFNPTRDPAEGHDKRLYIEYEFVDALTGRPLEPGWAQTLTSREQLRLQAQPSWFSRVVSVADMAQSLIRSGAFARPLLTQAVRLLELHGSHVRLCEELQLSPDVSLVLPDMGIPGAAFTVSFWLFLASPEDDFGGGMLCFKGMDDMQSRYPALELGPSRHLTLHTSTSSDWRERVQDSRGTVPLRQWVHVAAWCDGSHSRIYTDGLRNVEHALAGMPLPNALPMHLNRPPPPPLGAWAALETPGLRGLMRDARYYPRALADGEIGALVSAFRPPKLRSLVSRLGSPVPSPPSIARTELERRVQAASRGWRLAGLVQLTELATAMCEQAHQSVLSVDLNLISPPAEILQRYPELSGEDHELLRFKFTAVRLFNRELKVVLPLVDFSQTHLSWSLAHNLSRLTGLTFRATKTAVWERILRRTMSRSSRPAVTMSRPRAMRAREKGDPEGKNSIFGQAFRQLHFLPPAQLRQPGDTWRTIFRGEGGTDAGGLFRDSMTDMCNDLQSSYVPLFVPCPNSSGFGENQEKWIPNPTSTSSLHLSMFSFVGKMMGAAVRGGHLLNLDFPSLVWKKLVGAAVTEWDLELVDRRCADGLRKLLRPDLHDITPDSFEYMGHSWCTNSSDGRQVDLRPEGSAVPVRWEEREEYAAAVLDYRLAEFDEQLDFIRRGLGAIVPVQLLSLFTWQELERSVCGSPVIDISFMQRNTRYQSGFSADDPHVKMLWEVLESYSQKQRELFLCFVWGRSRLPASDKDWKQKFVLLGCRHNTDRSLPISHTCFFQLELPRYSCAEAMRERILYAITNCRAIDTDHGVGDNTDWLEEDDAEVGAS